jgi:hypothetical protein
VSTERRPDVSPWRVKVRPDVTLHWYEYLDARQIAPRMLYVKRWAPEDWPFAFQGQIHLLSSQDFQLIEHEMRRTIDRRSRRRERPPIRPRLPAGAGEVLHAERVLRPPVNTVNRARGEQGGEHLAVAQGAPGGA